MDPTGISIGDARCRDPLLASVKHGYYISPSSGPNLKLLDGGLFARICSGVLVQTKGWQRSFQPLLKARILVISSRTERKVPRWMACFSMIENQTSTRFSH